MVIKNANVYRIIGMLCFNALWQVHRFVSQVYGWIVYKINKLAPKWEKKSFPFVSVLDSFLSCLEGILELISSTCLLWVTFFPPLTSKLVVQTVSLKGRIRDTHMPFSDLGTRIHYKVNLLWWAPFALFALGYHWAPCRFWFLNWLMSSCF